jgi:hypothetical protein
VVKPPITPVVSARRTVGESACLDAEEHQRAQQERVIVLTASVPQETSGRAAA